MYQGVISGAAEAVPEAALLDIPYLADSLEEYRSICEGPILDWLQPFFHARNLHLLSLETVSFRGVFSSEPVRTAEELLKQKGVYYKLYKLQAEALKTVGIE